MQKIFGLGLTRLPVVDINDDQPIHYVYGLR